MDEHKAELGKHAAFAAETSKAGKSRFSAASPLPPHPEIERERESGWVDDRILVHRMRRIILHDARVLPPLWASWLNERRVIDAATIQWLPAADLEHLHHVSSPATPPLRLWLRLWLRLMLRPRASQQ